jgi:glycosyltransferase involved in cell wall biosynthesis
MPVFSIIIPTFNAAQKIGSALQSVLSQSFDKFEVLVIDGKSVDGTLEIARKFSDPRVQVISEPDSGIYDAMNKGISMAKGEWIYFLGSDDSLMPDVLENVYSRLLEQEYDVVYGQVEHEGSGLLYLGEFDAEKLIFYNISHQSIFIRRNVFDLIGKFDLKYKICADHILNVKWFFDQRIKKKYIPTVIARFGLSGVSNNKEDMDKIRDLPAIVRDHAGFLIYSRYYIIRPLFSVARRFFDRYKSIN